MEYLRNTYSLYDLLSILYSRLPALHPGQIRLCLDIYEETLPRDVATCRKHHYYIRNFINFSQSAPIN